MSSFTKRKVARSNVTRLINEIDRVLKLDEKSSDDLSELLDRIDGARQTLQEVNDECSSLIEEKDAEAEWENIYRYDDQIITSISRLRRAIKALTCMYDSASSSTHTDVETDVRTSVANKRDATPNATNERNEETSARLNNSNASSESHRKYTRLPKIEIKHFNGDLDNWLPFWDMFNNHIHENAELNDTEKFSYLQTYLKGKAAKSIAGLTATGTCYNDAIALLKDEYANEVRIADTIFAKLMDIQRVKNTSDATALRNLYNEVT